MQHISLSLADGRSRAAVLALPDPPDPPEARARAPGLVPGVIVLHDITGFREDTLRHCRRFAAAGYAALAPDLFDGGKPSCVVRTLVSLQKGEGEGLEVIRVARSVLAAHAGVDADRLGVVGFCMGGGFALLAAADEAFAVAGPFYGPVPRDRDRLRGICPTIAQFGAEDLTFRSHSARLRRHLDGLDVPHEVVVHPGAGHSFMNDHPDPAFALGRFTPLRARHEPTVEADAWARLLGFFAEHLGAVPPADAVT
jgi:carboxymethylenebutenolidase